ncbi:MAG: DNA polymerase Y family protein [bacterium]
MKRSRRIGCVHIPSFPIAVAEHAAVEAGEPDTRPLALVVGRGNRARVQMANRAALEAGVRPERHTVARARACTAELRLMAWDDAVYARAHEELAARLLEHTPAVTRAGMGCFWLDASGRERLGGERPLAEQLLATAVNAGYPGARVAIAGSVVAAEAAARLPGPPVTVIPPGQAGAPGAGEDAEFLAFLPLALLPLDPELHEVLETMGLQTVGELAALPAPSLEIRFGAAGLAARDLARGIDPRGPITCGGPSARLAEMTLEPPAETLDALVFGARGALVSLLRTLERQGAHVARLRLHFQLEGDHPPIRREVGLSRPTARLGPLVDLCRATLETLTLPAPVVSVGVEALEKVSAVRGEQGNLFRSRFRDPEALDATLSRIRARCGSDSVVRPVAADTHLEEADGHWVPETLAEHDEPPPPPTPAGHDPLAGHDPETSEHAGTLRMARRVPHEPEILRARGIRGAQGPERPGAPWDSVPSALELDQRWQTLTSAGPARRLSGEWWNDGYQRRDHVVTTAAGARLLISRPEIPPDGAAAPHWVLLSWED